MKRWFYILIGGLGFGLSLAAIFLLLQAPFVPPAWRTTLLVSEYVSIPIGLVLGWMGLVHGRRAGEIDVRSYNRKDRKRDYHVMGAEIDFVCPACRKGYRASPLTAGKPFNCRECNQTFVVPEKSNVPPISQQRLLPLSA